MKLPRLSIIIAVKNAKSFLINTLDNLQRQRYPDWEVIVIDGHSTDGTYELLSEKRYFMITHWISEPDGGISEAFNKGLALATGQYINFQGAGDSFCSEYALSELFTHIKGDPDLVCARVLRVEEDGTTPLWRSPRYYLPFRPWKLLFRMALPHQALFTHRRFFQRYGDFDPQCRFAMDYELLLRAYHCFPRVALSNQVIARWRAGGVGTDRMAAIFDEYHAIKLKHRVASKKMLKAIDDFIRLKWRIKSAGIQIKKIGEYIVKNNAWPYVPIRLLQAIAFQFYKRIINKTWVKSLFNGSKIYLFAQSPIASTFVYAPYPDQAEIKKLRSLADKHTIFLDVGANIGAYSLLLQDKVREVYAFEAHPETAKWCKKNFILNKIDPAHVVEYAVGEDNQPKYFTNLPAGHPTNSRSASIKNTIEVPATTLDNFIAAQAFDPTLSFLVKIDVEGFEYEVFAGAQQLLSAGKIKGIIFENFSDKQEAIITTLRQWGYSIEKIGQHNTFAYLGESRDAF